MNIKFTIEVGTFHPFIGHEGPQGEQRYILYFWPRHQKGVRGQRHAPVAPYPQERPGTHCTGCFIFFGTSTKSQYGCTLLLKYLQLVITTHIFSQLIVMPLFITIFLSASRILLTSFHVSNLYITFACLFYRKSPTFKMSSIFLPVFKIIYFAFSVFLF